MSEKNSSPSGCQKIGDKTLGLSRLLTFQKKRRVSIVLTWTELHYIFT